MTDSLIALSDKELLWELEQAKYNANHVGKYIGATSTTKTIPRWLYDNLINLHAERERRGLQ